MIMLASTTPGSTVIPQPFHPSRTEVPSTPPRACFRAVFCFESTQWRALRSVLGPARVLMLCGELFTPAAKCDGADVVYAPGVSLSLSRFRQGSLWLLSEHRTELGCPLAVVRGCREDVHAQGQSGLRVVVVPSEPLLVCSSCVTVTVS